MNYLRTSDLTRAELEDVILQAALFKSGVRADKPLEGKSVGLVFFDPSLRTRTSMQVAVHELGGNAVILEPGGNSWAVEHRDGTVMDEGKAEHIREFVGVLQEYVSVIGVRTFPGLANWDAERQDPVLSAFERLSRKPVINLESAMHHPCQAAADLLTIRERFEGKKVKVLLVWAWHPRPLPMAVPNSFALAAAQFGHDVTIAHPEGFDLDGDLMAEIEKQASENGGSVSVVNDPEDCFEGVKVVYAKSWASSNNYGNPEAEIAARAGLRDKWMVDPGKMKRTDEAAFMHCLPVRRNVVVTDEVIDGPRSIVLEQAANRLHTAKAVLARAVGE